MYPGRLHTPNTPDRAPLTKQSPRPARSCSPHSQILGAVWHHRTSKGPFKPKSVPLYAPCSLHGVKKETTILVHFWRGATMTAHAQLCTDQKYAFRFLAMAPCNYPSHWFAIRMLPRLTLTEQRRSPRRRPKAAPSVVPPNVPWGHRGSEGQPAPLSEGVDGGSFGTEFTLCAGRFAGGLAARRVCVGSEVPPPPTCLGGTEGQRVSLPPL